MTLVKMALDYEAEPWEAKELIKRHIYTLRQKVERSQRNHNLSSMCEGWVPLGEWLTAVTATVTIWLLIGFGKRPFLLYTHPVCH
ncbi:MAG: hypothetical protein IPK53_07320 [bacterium]|nr:hypothetical protein [bacterium]